MNIKTISTIAAAAMMGGCATSGYEPVVGAASACEHLETQAYLNCLERIENVGPTPVESAANALIQQTMMRNFYDRLNQPVYVIPYYPYQQRW